MNLDRFLIIRLSSLGDIIHTLPAFSALRKKFPQANITWLVEEKGREILELVPGIDRIVDIKMKRSHPGSKKFWGEFSNIKKRIRNKNQVALDFQGLIKSGFLAKLSKAKIRIGFHKHNLKEPLASLFYTDRLAEISEDMNVISKNMKLLSQVGIQEEKSEFPLLLPDESKESVRLKLKETGYDPGKRMIILNVGAAWETKRWFPDRWAELIFRLKKEQEDLFPLLLWGNETERNIAEEIREKTETPLSPLLSLQEVMALIDGASLVVSGDTFALQVACALSRPVVGIFGPTNPQRNGPFDPQDKVSFHELECSYCYKRNCSRLECLHKITAEEVARLCLIRLEEND